MSDTIIIPDSETSGNALSTVFAPRWRQAAFDWLANFNSERTRQTYAEALNAFLTFVQRDPQDVTQSDVIAFKLYLETATSETGKPYAPTTINLHLSAISSFYRIAMEHDLRDDNPADGVKRKKINPYGKATFMNGDEAKQFLAAIPAHTVQGRRDRAIMLIFLTLAVRISAIAGLRYGDVRRQGERVFLSYKDKGGDIVEMELKPVARAALAASLADRDELTPDSPLFCATERGKRVIAQTNAPGKTGGDATADQPLSARHIRRLVKKYADAAFGKGHGIHPHSLRHTAAMLASETGTMRQVMNLLRHSGMRVTSIYLDHLLEQDISEMVETLDALFAEKPAQEDR